MYSLQKNGTSLQHFLYDCETLKNQRQELFEATNRLLTKKGEKETPSLSELFAKEDMVQGESLRNRRVNSVKILKATAKYLTILKDLAMGEKPDTT